MEYHYYACGYIKRYSSKDYRIILSYHQISTMVSAMDGRRDYPDPKATSIVEINNATRQVGTWKRKLDMQKRARWIGIRSSEHCRISTEICSQTA